ncbi:hypothetical protein ACFRAO_33760 [Streptomyces sp. NPDC056656]
MTLAAMAAVIGLILTDETARPQLLRSTGATALVVAVAGVQKLRARRA